MGPNERPVIPVARVPVEQKTEFIPFIPVAPSKPESIKSIQETLSKPVEIPTVEQRLEPKPQPKIPYLLRPQPVPGFGKKSDITVSPIQKGPSPIKGRPSTQVEGPEPTGAKRGIHEPEEISEIGAPELGLMAPEMEPNARIRKALEEFMTRAYTSKEYTQALDQQHAAFFNKVILPALSLTTLHTHIRYAVANEKTANTLQPLLGKCLGYSQELVVLFAQEKPSEGRLDVDIQELLEKAFAYILVCFDALVQGLEKQLSGVSMLATVGSWIGVSESPEFKRLRVKHMLDIFSLPIIQTIYLFYKNFVDYCPVAMRVEFRNSAFDVATITDTYVEIGGVEHTYLYGSAGNLPVTAFHQKEYQKIIAALYERTGAPEPIAPELVFESEEMQKCLVNLQHIVSQLEQIVDQENWSIDSATKDELTDAEFMLLEAINARRCLQAPEEKEDDYVVDTYEKAIALSI